MTVRILQYNHAIAIFQFKSCINNTTFARYLITKQTINKYNKHRVSFITNKGIVCLVGQFLIANHPVQTFVYFRTSGKVVRIFSNINVFRASLLSSTIS